MCIYNVVSTYYEYIKVHDCIHVHSYMYMYINAQVTEYMHVQYAVHALIAMVTYSTCSLCCAVLYSHRHGYLQYM